MRCPSMRCVPLIRQGALVLIAVCLFAHTAAPRSLAQAPTGGNPGTTPVPANTDWDQETQNAVNAINAYRAAQQAPLPALQVDATLQNAVAWMANNQMVTKNCLANQGNVTCSGLDTLQRDPGQRAAAFGYTGNVTQNYGFPGFDTPADISTGQGIFDSWRTSMRATTPNLTMLDPNSAAIGIARQCQTFSYGFACIWFADFGTNLNQPFGPAAQPVTAQPATTTAAAPSFTGTWNVDSFVTGPGGPLRLVQTGSQVIGTYSYPDPSGCGTMNGTFTGTLNGTIVTFSSTDMGCGASNGAGVSGATATLSADGMTFTSTGGAWDGTRTGP